MANSRFDRSSNSNSRGGATASGLASDQDYQSWCHQQMRTDYSDPELIRTYLYLQSQGMV